MARIDWQGAKEWLRRTLELPADDPAYVHDPVHGPILVTPVQPDHPDRPYRVESPSLGVLELDALRLVVRGPGLVGRIRPSTARVRRAASDVRVEWAGHELHLKHTRGKRAELRLDRARVARLARHAPGNGGLDKLRATYEVRWEQPVPTAVVLLGHALASRYGVGAEGALLRLGNDLS